MIRAARVGLVLALIAPWVLAHETTPPPATTLDLGGVRLNGVFAQGGLIFGRAPPGSVIALDGAALRISPDGIFVFGFGRDHAGSATLGVTLLGAAPTAHPLSVVQRSYPVQRIDGLPPRQVTPPRDVLDRIRRENNLIGEARGHDTAETWFAAGFVWPAREKWR